ncbi:MAG: DUF402 domain-containing protein [Myxococcaceae bacterium]|nr:DUF402 domain-containing protein [Myxococcaceae bacterium]MCI0669389.1 DUF402 domain-containing protein [Myxococcaceae bacterium]
MPLFTPGQDVAVHHDKPWKHGRPIRLHGTVASFDGETLVLARRFRGVGFPYDGLYARKHAGDSGTLEVTRGGWVSRRRYVRRTGALIGESFNIQTPARFLPGQVLYVDLEVDVVYVPHRPEPVEVQDVDDLEAAVASGLLPPEVAAAALEVSETLAARLRLWDGQGPLDWDVRPAPEALTPAVQRFLAHVVSPDQGSVT